MGYPLKNRVLMDTPYITGDVILEIYGSAHTILLLERTLLNILGRMSGIATQTRTLQDVVRSINPKCKITATQKNSTRASPDGQKGSHDGRS
jgi:Nicotinate-nucleotide pyrophosphorylase